MPDGSALDRIWTPEQVELAKTAEAWETDEWAARALFQVELFTPRIIDPCCGRGVLGRAARGAGYNSLDMFESDLHDWGYGNQRDADFLSESYFSIVADASAIMNAPFSLATEFVAVARARRARKVACFQRWAWWAESDKRRRFWEEHPPARIWACGDRATCFPVTMGEQERRFQMNGKRRGSSKVAHAWFIWERHHAGPPLIGKIWDETKKRKNR